MVLLPREFHGQRSLAGYSPLGHKESNMTEQLHCSDRAQRGNAKLGLERQRGLRDRTARDQ